MKNKVNIIFLFCCFLFLIVSCKSTYIPENDFSVHQDFADNPYNQLLLDAVKNCDLETARKCLDENADPAVYDILYQSALMYACWNSDFSMVKLLCEYKKNNVFWLRRIGKTVPDVNRTSHYDYSALFCAAYRGNYDILSYLILEMDAKLIDIQDTYDQNINKNIRIVSVFKDSNDENILHKLAKSKSPINTEKFLSEFSVYKGEYIWKHMIYEKDKNGYTPFHYAVISDDLNMVKLLLSLDSSKTVLNSPAGSWYPLYTAYQIRNLDIFKFLLEQSETIIDNPIPTKSSSSEPVRMSLQTFSTQESTAYIQSKQFDPDLFQKMYEARLLWEQDGMVGNPVVEPLELKQLKDEFYEAVKNPLIKVEDLKQLQKKLGSNLFDIGYDKEKDLLQIAIDTEREDEERIAVLKFLLDNGVKSRNTTDSTQALSYALTQTNNKKETIYLDIIKFLIKNHSQYSESYSLNLPNFNRPWMQILSSEYIRNSLSFEELKEILGIMNKSLDFKDDREHIFEYILGKNRTNIKYTDELFNYFFYLLDDVLYVSSDIPIAIWLYQNNYRYGIRKILENPIVADRIKLKNDYYVAENIRFKDLLIRNNDTEFLEMYYSLYPKEKPEEKVKKTPSENKEIIFEK